MADLRVIDAEPVGRDVVQEIEQALKLAKSGELSSIAIAGVKRDGSPHWGWSYPPSHSLLIGVVERMKCALVRAVDGGDD